MLYIVSYLEGFSVVVGFFRRGSLFFLPAFCFCVVVVWFLCLFGFLFCFLIEGGGGVGWGGGGCEGGGAKFNIVVDSTISSSAIINIILTHFMFSLCGS